MSEIKDFWEEQHLKDNRECATDGGLDGIAIELEIEDLLKSAKTVLEIGVGTGKCAKMLHERGYENYAVDIAEAGLARVKDFIVEGWLAENIDKLPSDKFDLAFSRLVAQHMSDDDLKIQMEQVVRSLKSNGIFAMQLAHPLGPRNNLNATPFQLMTWGEMTRHLYKLDEMVLEAGGHIVFYQHIDYYPQHNMGWFKVHIRRSPHGKLSKV